MVWEPKSLILAVDAGGTGLRALLFDRQGEAVFQEFEPLPAAHPEEGATEFDPLELWSVLKTLLVRLLKNSGVDSGAVAALGITNQRSSFCFWDRETGEPLSKIISWQDVRAADVVDRMNRSPAWGVLRKAAGLVGFLTRGTMMTATSMLEFNTDHTITKVRWLLDRDPLLAEKCLSGRALFGTLDSWMLYKLTGGKEHLTDLTNASSTAMFNPFDLIWNPVFCRLFDIPMGIFPGVKDSGDNFGVLDPSLLGTAIPVSAMAGDQQASLFGHTCFHPGDVKISMGSGAFVNMNVGPRGRLSRRGLFPLIAWRVKGDLQYMLEGQLAALGTMINWSINRMGWFRDPEEINSLAASCEDSGGMVLVPTPTGIRFPYFRPRMKAVVTGMGLDMGRAHLARALLEGFAHRLTDILEGIEEDTGVRVKSIKVDGGVSRSDELLQSLADLSGCRVERSSEVEVTARGAAYLAGLAVGFWKDTAQLAGLRGNVKTFEPARDSRWREKNRKNWKIQVKKLL